MVAQRPATMLSGRALLAVSIWGASFVATRIALRSFDPLWLVAARMLLAAGLLALVVCSSGRPLLPERADRARCLLLGLVLGSHLLLQAWGLRWTSAINTGWIISATPVLIALGSWLALGQRMRAVGWGGVALAMGGVLVVTRSTPAEFARAGAGDLLQLASCGTWTLYTLAAAAPVARSGPLRVTTAAIAVAAAATLVGALSSDFVVARPGWQEWLAVGYLGLLSSGLAMLLWYQALRDEGPTRIGALLYFEPFVTLAAARLVLDEEVTVLTIPGGLLVLAGVWLVGRATRNG